MHGGAASWVVALAAGLLSAMTAPAAAQDATWLLNPGSGDFNTAGNWTPAAVPTGTAFFGLTNNSTVSFSAPSTTVGGWTFNAGASSYTFTISGGQALDFNGAGITDNGISTVTISNSGSLEFFGNSTAGGAIIFNDAGGTAFRDFSSAGNAVITNNAVLDFFNSSSAGSADITNNGTLTFTASSTAGDATVTTNSGATTAFFVSSTGGDARFITNLGGTFDMSSLTSGGMTAGSIEGGGSYVLGANELTVGSNNLSTEVSGVISGAGGSLVKEGTGTLTLSGVNTYDSGTIIRSGTVETTNDDALGTGDVTLDGAALRAAPVTPVDTITLSNNFFVGGTSGIAAATGTTLSLQGDFDFTVPNSVTTFGSASDQGMIEFDLSGAGFDDTASFVVAGGTVKDVNGSLGLGLLPILASTTVDAGATLDLSNSGIPAIRNLTGAGSIEIGPDPLTTLALLVDSGTTTEFSGVISGSGSLEVITTPFIPGTDPGRVVLSGDNTYTGDTYICDCTELQVGNGGTTGTINGDVFNSGTLIFNRSDTYVFGGNIVDDFGAGQVVQDGTGTTVLTGTNTYTGGTTINAGTLQIGNGGGGGSLVGDVLNNSALVFNLSSPSSFAGDISGTGSLTKQGAGQLSLEGDNTYTGATGILAGTVRTFSPFANNAIGDQSAVTVAAGATLLITTAETIGSLSGGGAVQGDGLDPRFLTVGANGSSTTYSGVISGSSLNLTKIGAGTQTLGGTNTYGGTTTVTAGTLLVNGSIASSSSLTVNAGATIGGSGTLPDTVVNGTLSPGNSPGTLTINGDLTLGAASISLFELAAPGAAGGASNDLVNVNGNLTLAGTLQTPSAVSGYYRLFNVTGTTSGGFATVPTGATVITAIPNQVNLLFQSTGQLVSFWDGPDQSGNGVVDGGTGTWNAANTNWTGAPGSASVNGPWASQVGVFAGTAGTVTVSGPVAFQGLQFSTTGYTVAGGALTMTGNPAGNAAAGFVNVDDGVTATIVSALTGGAGIGLDKLGGGTLVLTGTNTYKGTTTVTAGTLQAGAAGALVNGAAYTVNGGTLDLNGFDLTMSEFTGTGGAVALGSGNLTVNQTSATSFAGSITGTGTFTKAGTGALTLSGTSTYTGQTFVNQGVLSVNGSIASSSLLTINAGGTLGGTGLLPSVIVNGGTLAPGNSIGTVTVSGNVTFGAGSTYAVEVSPDAADSTNVSGTANLSGATVAATYAAGTYVEKSYTILSAQGGLGGTSFAGLTGTVPTGFEAELAYDANNAYLVLDLEMRGPDFGSLNRNQRSVANAIVGYFDANGGIPAEFAALDPNGLTQVSGEPTAGAITAGIESADRFLDLIAGQAAQPGTAGAATDAGTSAYAEQQKQPAAEQKFASLGMEASHAADPVGQVFASRWTSWGAAYGGSETVGGDPVVGSHDTETTTFGLAAGTSYRFQDTTFGIALGGGSSDFSLSDGLGGGHADTFNAGLYGRQGFGSLYLAGALAYGFNAVETERAVPGETLTGKFDAHSFSGRIEAGYNVATPVALITPYAAFQAIAYRLPAYSETSDGAGAFALAYDGSTTTATRTELGLRLDRTLLLDDGASLTLSGRAAWAINSGDTSSFTAGFQTLPGTAFTIDGAEPDQYGALIDAGAEYRSPSGFFAALAFQGEFSGNLQTYAGKATVGFTW